MAKEEKKGYSLRERCFPFFNDDILESDKDSPDSPMFLYRLGWRWARSIVLGAAVLWGGYEAIGNNIEYSTGLRVGMVNKVAEKGLFWKTYEGQMALEGIVSGGSSSGANVWDFSIDRQAWHGENPKELADKISGYAEAGTKVKITYNQPFATWPWRAGTTYLVQSVEPVAKK